MKIANLHICDWMFAKTNTPTSVMIEEYKAGENGSINVETSYIKIKMKTLIGMFIGVSVFLVTSTWTLSVVYNNILTTQLKQGIQITQQRTLEQSYQNERLIDSILVSQRRLIKELISPQRGK